MIVAVTGGRDFRDHDLVGRKLAELQPSIVVHGGASGADRAAGAWAQRNDVPEVVLPYARIHGRAGGPIRNGRILKIMKPDVLLAFPGGDGTADMVRQAQRTTCLVYQVRADQSVFQVAPCFDFTEHDARADSA